MHDERNLFLSFALVLCLASPAARAEIVLDNESPVREESTTIRVTDAEGNPVPGAAVEVTYRPGSSVSRVAPVGRADAAGTLTWTPQEAGIATITATWEGPGHSPATSSATVSVRFQSPPIDGILIMVFAGVLLILGSIVRITNLLRTPEPH